MSTYADIEKGAFTLNFIGFYDYTVILTYLSLISSLAGMCFAVAGRPGVAMACLALSGICDLFDGTVARTKKGRTEDEKSFGIQLDSMCDVVCFGVFPAVFLYFSGVDGVGGFLLLSFYVLCAVIRLAFFNVLEAKRQAANSGSNKSFRGLPVTTAAMVFPAVFLLGLLLPRDVCLLIYHVLPAVMGFLFILDVRVPKLDVSGLIRRAPDQEKSAEHQPVCHKQE